MVFGNECHLMENECDGSKKTVGSACTSAVLVTVIDYFTQSCVTVCLDSGNS